MSVDPKTTIAGEHQALRALLGSLDDAARRVLAASPGGMTALREATRAVDTTFRAHLALEESLLVPILRGASLERMRREHRAQRVMLEAIVSEVEHDPRDPMQLAYDARWLVAALARDMDAEDAALANLGASPLTGQLR